MLHLLRRGRGRALPAARRFAAQREEVQLFVYGIPLDATVDDIIGVFEGNACAVRDVFLPQTRKNKPRGVAFATVDALDAVRILVDMDAAVIRDCMLTVELADPNKLKGDAPRRQPHVSGRKEQAIFRNDALVKAATASAVLSIFEREAADFTAVNFATALYRLGLVGKAGADAELLSQLVELTTKSVSKSSKEWDAQGLSSACWGAAKQGVDAQLLFDAVAADALHKMMSFEAQALSNLVWSFATAGIQATRLFESVAAEAPRKMKRSIPQGLSNMAWAYATAGIKAPALFERIAEHSLTKIAAFDPQALANITWSFQKAGVSAPKLFDAVAFEAAKKVSFLNPRELSSLVHTYATADFPARALYEAVAAEAPRKMSMFNAQELSNTAWAFATAGREEPLLFEALAAKAPGKVKTFNPQALASTVWAFATVRVKAPSLFDAFSAEILFKIKAFDSQALANIVWAYATMGVSAPLLFEAVAVEATRKVSTLTSPELASIVWAFSRAGVSAPALFEAVALEAPKKIETFNSHNLANTSFHSQALGNIVWAYATAGIRAPALFEAVALEAPKKIKTFNSQGLASILWAFSAVDDFTFQAHDSLFEAMTPRVEAKILESSPESLAQLHQVAIVLRHEAPRHALTAVLTHNQDRLRQAYLRVDLRPSRPRGNVSETLSRIGWELEQVGWNHEMDHEIAEGIRLDLAQPASNVAVELDDETCYLAGGALDGTAKFREKLLRCLGWRLVRVPHEEWDALTSADKREAFLRAGLEAAGLKAGPRREAVQAVDDNPGEAAVDVELAAADAGGLGGAAEVFEPGEAAYGHMEVKDLKLLLKRRGINQSGTKRALVQRLGLDDAK